MSLRRRLRRVDWRAALRRLGFSLVPLLGALLAVELAARALTEPPEALNSASMHPHPTRIWAFPEGVITSGGKTHQIRPDRLRAVEETGAALRALTLGDSSIFGHGLDDADTLHASLADALTARGHPTDVFCGGIPGYSSFQSRVVLEEEGWDLKPDLLVIGNLWSDSSQEYFVDKEWLAELDSPARRLDRLLDWSRAWGWFRSFQVPEQAVEQGLPVGWVRERYASDEGRRRVAVGDYAANLDWMLRQAAEREIGAIFLAPCNRLRQREPTGAAAWTSYFEAMAVVAARRGVPVVDACETLTAAGLKGDAAFIDDLHPSGDSNRAYAEALAEALTAAGWPEARLAPDPGPPALESTE